MAFTLGNIAAKDGTATTIGGGLLAADIAGGGVGPWVMFYGLVDGLAGVNRLNITAANAMKVDGSAVTQPVSGTVAISGTVSAIRASVAPVVSTVLESGHVLKASAGSLFSLQFATTTLAGWVMLFDAASVPADGAVTPKKAWAVDLTSSSTYQWDTPLSFATGISIAFSTTGPFTKTASATAFFSGEVV